MTLRDRQCRVQVQASRVSARIAALTLLALAPALAWHPATLGDDTGRSARGMGARQPRRGRQTERQQGTLGGSNRLLSSRDVAAILAVPERTVRDKWKEWGLPAYRIGKHLRWKERDVYAWIDRQSA
jgi:excisionase family DNA binding protein